MRLCKWSTEEELGDIAKKINKIYKKQLVVERHNRPRPEEIR